MGFFPILMNVVQFWLIDSIVKAGGIGSIALPSDSPDPADREPLFHSSTNPTSEDDDSEVGDVIASPAKRDVEAQAQAQLLRRSNDSSHTYPPSLTGSLTLTGVPRASISPPPLSRSVLSARRHRSPPAPLLPRSPKVPVLNSPELPPETGADVSARSKEDWQEWDGDEEWLDRVSEDDRTGRPAEAQKGEADSD